MIKKSRLKNKILLLMSIIFLVINSNLSAYAQDVSTNSTSPIITMSKNIVTATDKVDVTIANGSTDHGAWVGLYNENDKPGSAANGGVTSIWWKSLSDLKVQSGNGKFTLDFSSISGIEAGKNYKLILFKDGNYVIDASVNFQTSNPTTPPTNNTQATIAMSENTVVATDKVDVTVANGSTAPGAWVGLYNENDKPGSAANGGVPSIWWKYLSELNIQNGKFSINFNNIINSLKDGETYKLVLFKDSGYTIDATVKFQVSKPQITYNLEPVQVKTQVGIAPNLPSEVTRDNSDGTTSEVSVTWNKIDSYLYSNPESFTVEGTVAGTAEKARANVDVIDGDGPLYTFDILSDTHVSTDSSLPYNSNFDYALKEMNKLDKTSSGLIIDGDVVNSGLEENWEEYDKILNQNKHPQKVDIALGNHDTWQQNNSIDQSEYKKSKENFLKHSGKPNVYYDDWINGNHFIFLGSEQSDGDTAYFSDDQLKWFDNTLAENAANNKPIFVFIHQPLHGTVAGSKDGQGSTANNLAQDAQVRQILAKYPQAILLTGHTHWEFGSKDMMYNANYCTMFNLPACAYCWTDDNEGDDISEGYYVEVYKDKVLLKGRNFTTREWDETSQYQINYQGSPENALVSVKNNALLTSTPQFSKLSLTADKTMLGLNSGNISKLTLNAVMSDGSKTDLSNAIIQYSSDNTGVATVDSKGIVAPVGKGTAKVTARVTLNGVTESVTQQIKVGSVQNPVFSLDASKFYTGEQTLSISCPTDGAVIRYTTDGTDPTVNSKVYTMPIVLSSSTTVKAYASKDGYSDSSIVSTSYSIETPQPQPYIPPTPQPETRDGSVVVDGTQAGTMTVPVTRTTDSNGVKADNLQFSEDNAAKAAQEAFKTEAKTVAINVSDIPGNNADKVDVNVPEVSMTQFINNGISLNIDTEKAKLELPIETVKGLNAQDTNVEIDDVKDSSEIEQINNTILQMVSGATVIGNSIDIKTNYLGRTKIVIPFKAGQVAPKDELSSLAVMVKHSDGEITVDKGNIVYDEKGNAVGISVWVNKFSTFTLIKLPDTYFNGTTTVIPYKVNANKEWQIRFTKEADKNTINNENIYVIDSKGNKVDINISYGSDNILKISPINNYTSGETYNLYISKKVSSKDGKVLTNELKYVFTVE